MGENEDRGQMVSTASLANEMAVSNSPIFGPANNPLKNPLNRSATRLAASLSSMKFPSTPTS